MTLNGKESKAGARGVRQRRCLIALGLFVLIASCAGYFLYKLAVPLWYSWRAKWCLQQAVKMPPTSRQGELLKEYDRYRDRLVDLGYLEARTFRLRHIRVPSADYKRFVELVRQHFPDNIHVRLGGYESGVAELMVWDRPYRLRDWERFVLQYDITNLASRLDVK